jgi:hypothetical protein
MVARLADPAWRQVEVVDEWDAGDAWGDLPALAFGFEGSLEAANRDAAMHPNDVYDLRNDEEPW